jgi:hypothetical protein
LDVRSKALPVWVIYFDVLRRFSEDFSVHAPDLSSSWLGILFDPFSRYLSGAGAASAVPLMSVLSSRVLGVDDAAQAWANLRGSWAKLPDVHPLPRDHMVNFPIRGVTDVPDGPVLFFPRPDGGDADPSDP